MEREEQKKRKKKRGLGAEDPQPGRAEEEGWARQGGVWRREELKDLRALLREQKKKRKQKREAEAGKAAADGWPRRATGP